MKLDEILSAHSSRIDFWADHIGIRGAALKIIKHPDTGEDAIDTYIDVDVGFKGIHDKLPFKFYRTLGFYAGPNESLRSIENLPDISFEVDLSNTGITSLVGIEKIIKETNKMFFQNTDIQKGSIGLLLIKNLKKIEFSSDNKGLAIISKYIGKPDSIFECQAELIDAGLEEFAIL